MLEKIFRLRENGTDTRTELLAGLTTFLTMAYIVFVQPAVLSKDFTGAPTGLDPGAVLLATCLISCLASVAMGLWSRYPIALAPGMGENFFFVSVIMTLAAQGVEHAWQTALGIVFISGILFMLLSALKVREALLNALSPSLRNGIAVGIGLFIAFLGLKQAGIIVLKPGTGLGMNANLATADSAVFFAGLLITSALHVRRVRGSILWGMAGAALLALVLGKISYQGILGFPDLRASAMGRMDIAQALSWSYAPFILVFLFMNVFDTLGTLVGVAEQAGLVKDNKLPRAGKVLMVDSAATTAGACLGTSTVVCYIESAAGVALGGRTGLTAVAAGLLFLLPLAFSPLVGMMAQYLPVTAPALVFVGVLMFQNVRKIDWSDYSEAVPAFLIMAGIPLSYSIADGLALGFLSYPLIKCAGGKYAQIRPWTLLMALILFLYFIFVRTTLP